MYFSGEIVSFLGIPIVSVAPGSAAPWRVGMVVWIVFVVSVEDFGGVKVGGQDDQVEEVVAGVWPRNEEEEERCIARTLELEVL